MINATLEAIMVNEFARQREEARRISPSVPESRDVRADLELLHSATTAHGDALEALMSSRDLIRTSELTDALVSIRSIQAALGRLLGRE